VLTPRWWHTVKLSEIWTASSTASSCTTYYEYNKAAVVLAKAASSQSPVPHGVFASDQHQPSVREEGKKPPDELEPKVMAIDQPPEVNLEDPGW
jgi:hypothetical protein